MTTKAREAQVVKVFKRGAFKNGKPFVELWLDELDSKYPNPLVVTYVDGRIPPEINEGDIVEISCQICGYTYQGRRFVNVRGSSYQILQRASEPAQPLPSISEQTPDDDMPF